MTSPHPVSSLTPNPGQEARLQQLLTDIRERAREFETQRYISQDIIDGFVEVGVYRALVPKRLGGREWSARQFCELIETISRADGSAGWVASFGMAPAYLAALPPETFNHIYGSDPDTVYAGGLFPLQPARILDDGRYEVSGRWVFASGCLGAGLIGAGIVPKKGEAAELPRVVLMPREQVEIVNTWDVSGLAGTGSHDVVIDKVPVDPQWSFVRGGPSNQDETMFRYPALSIAAQVLAVVSLGVARAAIDELRRMASHQGVAGSAALAERPATQTELGHADARLRAARSFFYEAIDEVWASLEAGDAAAPDQVSRLRQSSAHLTRVSAEVARAMQVLSGMAGIYNTSPLSRYVRDAQVVTQHAFLGDAIFQNAGSLLFGKTPPPGYL